MKTSEQWWEEVKADEAKLSDWLIKQYRGEVTAGDRVESFAKKYAPNSHAASTLFVIAGQERQHADWVLELLNSRGITPDVSNAEERYWKETLPEVESFETGAAIGAHAEAMRLKRIRAIVADQSAPEDVRQVFEKILKDEIFHEKAFRKLAGKEAMMKTTESHQRGMELLGLVD